MQKVLKTILITTIIINGIVNLSGQEIRSLSRNQVIINALGNKETNTFKEKSYQKPLAPPFFEDFSDYGSLPLAWPFPKSSKWTDSYAFINSEYADSMISIGVATLDAFDQFGFPYSKEKTDTGYSDTLSSDFFNIISRKDSLYLTFFYEAGGKGDKPETQDSLYVDVYTPKYKWVNLWQIPGGEQQHVFKQQIILIPDSLQRDRFRFRFRNHTSNENIIENKQSNADQWHLDYIQLIQTSRPDTLIYLNDAMVIEPLLPSLTEYSSVPYRHLDLARSATDNERLSTPIVVRTMYKPDHEPLIVTRYHSSFDVNNNKYKETDGGIANSMETSEVATFIDVFTADMTYNPLYKSGILRLKSYLNINDEFQRTVNDTLRRTEYYSDYYAYDDGTAEAGFGISGESQSLIYFANRYRIFRKSSEPDTLKAVYIYFNKSVDNSTADVPFKICVWKNDGDLPGEMLYESSEPLVTMDSSRSHLNDFSRFELETPVLVSDTIFVGIQQESATFINIGYDLNYNTLKNIYIKRNSDSWYNPHNFVAGSLMIRPSFGKEDPLVGIKKPPIESGFSIFPNPANDYLNLILPEEQRNTFLNIRIVDVMGKTLFHSITDNNSLDISYLQSGIYFIIISSADGNFRSTVKFLKNQ
jgi:hypothetical protein